MITDFTENQEIISTITAKLLSGRPISQMTIFASGILTGFLTYLTAIRYRPHYYEKCRIIRNRMHALSFKSYSSVRMIRQAVPPHILFIIADKTLSSYLLRTFSSKYRTTLLENPEGLTNLPATQKPDTIIIDETVNGIYGDELCSRIKSMEGLADIPVILLINSLNIENYRAHTACGADRLELRTTNINKLKADIRTLIDKHLSSCESPTNQLDKEAGASNTEDEETDNEEFLMKVNRLIEKNFSTEKYTIAQLSKDIGMSKTRFSNKIKEITRMPPSTYILSLKMEKARELLLRQEYSITEIATYLGFCDAKYFTKIFKECNNHTPSDYVKKEVRPSPPRQRDYRSE